MPDNDDINKSSKKSINEIGRALKSFEQELKFVPAGEVSILEKIRQTHKKADLIYQKINALKAEISSANQREAAALASLNALSAQYNATKDQQIRSQIQRDIRSQADEISAHKISRESARQALDPLEKEYGKLMEFAGQKSEMVEVKSAIRQESKQRHFINEIKSAFSESSFRGTVMREKRMPENLYRANILIAKGLSFEELSKKRQSVEQRIAEMKEEAIELGGSAFDLENRPTKESKKLQSLYSAYQNLTKYQASLDLALETRAAKGQDPFSREEQISKTSSFIEEHRRRQGISSEIESKSITLNEVGKSKKVSIDISDIESRLDKEMQGFVRILGERSTAIAKGEKNLDRFNKALEESSDNIRKLRDVAGAVTDSSTRDKRISNLIQGGYALQAVGGAIGQIFVGQTNAIANTKISAAQQSNDLFFRRQAALSGDMTQLTALAQGSPQLAEIEASRSEFLTNVAGTFGVVGDMSEAAGAIAASRMTGGALGGIGGGTRVGSSSAAIGVSLNAVSSVTGLVRNVNGNAEGRAEYNRRMQLSDEEIKIKGFQRQQFYNYSMGVTEATLAGGGEAGQKFFQQMLGGQNEYGPVRSSDQMLERMRAAGIGTDQMVQMAQIGLTQQGSVFNANQIFSAKDLQNKGYGTIESNLRMYGQLAGAGANNPSASFEKVLEVAVAKGFDSSKATSMLVENTAAMSQRSMGAALGIDVTGGALATIAGISASKEDQPNREFALSRATTAAQAYEAISSNTGISMTTMATMSQIQRAGGVGAETAKLLQGADLATLRDFQSKAKKYEKMSPNERSTFESELEKGGLFEFIDKKTGAVRTDALLGAIGAKTQGNLGNLLALSGKFNLNNKQEEAMFKQFMGGGYEELRKTKEGKEFTNKMNLLVPVVTGGAMTGYEASMGGKLSEIDTEEAKKRIEEEKGFSFKRMLGIKDAAAREQTTQAQLGAQEMGGITEAINRIAEATQVISKMGMDNKPGNFSELASKAAQDFNSGAQHFKDGMVVFDKALDKLSIKTNTPKSERPLNKKL